MLDAVDGGRKRALGDEYDAPFHIERGADRDRFQMTNTPRQIEVAGEISMFIMPKDSAPNTSINAAMTGRKAGGVKLGELPHERGNLPAAKKSLFALLDGYPTEVRIENKSAISNWQVGSRAVTAVASALLFARIRFRRARS